MKGECDMARKQKKPNLGTFIGILEKEGRYNNGYTEAWTSWNGYFYVKKDGITKLFYNVNDAWKSI